LKIAVASGKGGTGKTTVSVNLFEAIRRMNQASVTLADCDVEEPNDHVFLKAKKEKQQDVTTPIPQINKTKCVYCGKCAEICAFNAIMFVKPISHIQVMPDLCKSCGACSWVCPHDAISEYDKKLGELNQYKIKDAFLAEGRLEIGSPFSVPVIKQLKAQTPAADVIIYDSPPGTSCPVMETIHDVDFVLVVTEPTPFGVSDLKLMIQTLQKMNKNAAVLINRSMGDHSELTTYLEEQNLPVLMEIPFDRQLAAEYSNGKLFVDIDEEWESKFRELYLNIKRFVDGGEER
jgi:MinD superfamily P-loop ATPase